MSRNAKYESAWSDHSPQYRSGGGVFTAPLGSATTGLLVFATGAAGVTLLADPQLPGLARCRWTKHLSWVGLEEGILVVGCRDPSSLVHDAELDDAGGEITLNASLPWEIAFRGDAYMVTARFEMLQLRSLTISGEANQVSLHLSRPAGTAHLYYSGGAEIRITRPPDVPVGVNVQGSAARLRFDRQNFDAVERDTRLESAGFKQAFYRYEIFLAGLTEHLTIQ